MDFIIDFLKKYEDRGDRKERRRPNEINMRGEDTDGSRKRDIEKLTEILINDGFRPFELDSGDFRRLVGFYNNTHHISRGYGYWIRGLSGEERIEIEKCFVFMLFKICSNKKYIDQLDPELVSLLMHEFYAQDEPVETLGSHFIRKCTNEFDSYYSLVTHEEGVGQYLMMASFFPEQAAKGLREILMKLKPIENQFILKIIDRFEKNVLEGKIYPLSFKYSDTIKGMHERDPEMIAEYQRKLAIYFKMLRRFDFANTVPYPDMVLPVKQYLLRPSKDDD